MNLTPPSWIHSYAELKCTSCGRWLSQCGQTWENAEQEAVNTNRRINHKCGEPAMKKEVPLQMRIEKAAEVMRLIRKNNAPMSFEEEMEKYKVVMKTYKL